MTLNFRTVFFFFLSLLVLWFLFVERAILTPFVLAGCFAYIINPIINFFSHKIKLPRTISILIIYLTFMVGIVLATVFLSRQVVSESDEFKSAVNTFIKTTRNQVYALPDWIQPAVQELLTSLGKTKILSPQWLITFFPQAISRVLSFLIFLFSAFYFLKEGPHAFNKLINLVPSEHKVEVEILFRKINAVLGGYLRGQFFLIIIVSTLLFTALSILGVRFALILGLFSGIAEIVPIIGPFVAGFIACLVMVITQTNNFGLSLPQALIAIILIYFIVRQVQDYFITPHIMGIKGLILAVPIAAVIRILLEYTIDRVNDQYLETQDKKKILGRE